MHSRQEILKLWRALDPQAAFVVACVAVYEDRLATSKLARRAQQHPSGRRWKRWHRKALQELVASAKDLGLREEHGMLDLPPTVREAVVRALLRDDQYDDFLDLVSPDTDRYVIYWRDHGHQGAMRRLVRRALYVGDHTTLDALATHVPDQGLAQMLVAPLEVEQLLGMPLVLRVIAMRAIVAWRHQTLQPIDELDDFLLEQARAADDPHLWALVVGEATLRGDLAAARDGLPRIQAVAAVGDRTGLLLLAQGRIRAAEKAFAAWLAERRQHLGSDFLPSDIPGSLVPLAYLLRGTVSRRKQALSLLRRRADDAAAAQDPLLDGWPALAPLLDPERSDDSTANPRSHPAAVLLRTLAAVWTSQELPAQSLHGRALRRAREAGYHWLADELQAARSGDAPPHGDRVPLLSHREPESRWSRMLEAIETRVLPKGGKTRTRPDRLIWKLKARPFRLEARYQTGKRGGWTLGRVVSARHLDRGLADLKGATEQDRRIAACWDQYGHHDSSLVPGNWQWRGHVWAELIGHPLLFDADSSEPLTVVEAEPRLLVEQTPAGRRLRLDPPDAADLVVREVGAHGFEVIRLDKRQKELARLIQDGLTVPDAGGKRLDGLLEGLSEVVPWSAGAQADREEPGQAGAVVRLSREDVGLRCQLCVQPAGPGGPTLEPGGGSELILASLPGGAVRVRRDLAAERTARDDLRVQLPALDAAGWTGHEWVLPELADALELLAQLAEVHDQVRIEWHQGQPLQLRNPSAGGFSLAVEEDAGWFEARGSLGVDESEALELTRLLRLLAKRQGRFVELGQDEFLQLSERLVQQLERLERAGRIQRQGVRLHGLAAGLLESVADEADQVDASPAWQAQLQRMAAPPPPAELPVGLEAELRPYQLDGFRWMSRLASWGVGACLADDMGLGKTVQTLALLLARASLGPALVIAPTSVCPGWREQCWRFTPDLVAYDLRVVDRQHRLEHLVAGDLVVCSYGLLLSEQEHLARLRWATLVLDESQAIKNPRTKRHQAARSIQADFRLALTGTPVENRLEELWAQMAVLNPGLLGSEAHFRSRFARPAAEGEHEPMRQLRQLVRPVVLRRTKSQVLDDLPEKTVVDIGVELEGEEATVYEALRQQAEAATASMEGQERFQMLAWLTRLRLAACHPRLAVEDCSVQDSAKLKALAEIVEGLRDGGHRALIFSQFTSHLDIVQAWLEQQELPFQRLDGSTPAATRQQRVAAFQQGQGLVFLISLRAGGFGLNLTSADYVVHLDPWWNPAVETQASDRAHRIGQQRPVTVYRLFAQGTVEERILELQHAKREVAEALMEGAEAAASLSADELRTVLLGG